MCSKGFPAYAIVMSGGYKDDFDEGLMIDYTGEGGQTAGKHVSCRPCMRQHCCFSTCLTVIYYLS